MEEVDAELRALFTTEADERLERLIKALEAAALEAHTVKGAAAVTGLQAFGEGAAAIETMLVEPLRGARQLLQEIRGTWPAAG